MEEDLEDEDDFGPRQVDSRRPVNADSGLHPIFFPDMAPKQGGG